MRASFLLLALAGPAVSTAAIAAESAAPSKPQLICRSAQKAIGSRIRKPRRCMTAEQWRESDEAAARVPISLQVVAPKNEGKQRSQ